MASLTRLGAGHEEWRRWRDSVLLFQAEAAVEVLDYSVTFAGGGFEVFAVQDFDGAAQVFDQAGIFEGGCGEAHAGASRAEHLCEEFVS